ncbi:MAG: hypothetical protein J7479_17215, partial [Roseiflexus sp.]|nr:hypothetical protein [Roseiflexus sp.]
MVAFDRKQKGILQFKAGITLEMMNWLLCCGVRVRVVEPDWQKQLVEHCRGGGLYVFEIFPIKTQLTCDTTYSAHLEVFAACLVPMRSDLCLGCAICDANRHCVGATLCSPEPQFTSNLVVSHNPTAVSIQKGVCWSKA